jgi:hypothetical protein
VVDHVAQDTRPRFRQSPGTDSTTGTLAFAAGLLAIRPLLSRTQEVQYVADRDADRLWPATDRLADVSLRLETLLRVPVLASAAPKTRQRSDRQSRIKCLALQSNSEPSPGTFSDDFRFLFAMVDSVGNARSCTVSFVDSDGIRHSVEVAAESLYEAAALAVKEFRRHPWTDGMEPGAVTTLAVSVKSPATTHEVSIRQLERWVKGTAKSFLYRVRPVEASRYCSRGEYENCSTPNRSRAAKFLMARIK